MIRLAVPLALLALAPVSAAPAPAGAYVVAAAHGDIVVRRGGTVAFSARAFAAAEDAALRQLRGPDLATVEHRFAVVALAGPFLALRDEIAVNLAAPLPGGGTRLWAIDLRRPAVYRFGDEEPLAPVSGDATLVDLRTFFPPPTLAAAIAAATPGTPPTRDLRVALAALAKRGSAPPDCFAADAGVLSSFAVVGRSAARLTVELGLPGQPSCRFASTPLRITLPARGSLAAAIGSARIVRGGPAVVVALPVPR